MKRLLFSLLALGAGGCQSPATTSPAARPEAAAQPTAAALPAAALLARDSTAAVLALTQQVDLAPAWGNKTPDTKRYGALEGFYGPDNYRMSFYYDRVQQDARQPNVFHVWGRDRYKRTITPFTATLTVTRLASLPDTAGMTYGLPRPVRAYTAFATFTLREDATTKGSGHCQGRAALDFYVVRSHQAEQLPADSGEVGAGNPTGGCGLLFQGTWQDNQSGRQQPVAWANYYGVIVPEALAKLGLGMRSEEVDPRLARYGWNTIMENDEWWAKSPTPAVSF